MIGTTWASAVWLPLGIVLTVLAIAQFSSLQHELLHGHPFRNATLNHVLAFPALGLCIPYLRFQTTHLAHHYDPILTDPYDDPESNYLDPAVWSRLSRPVQRLLRLNNTLLGRMLLGPAIGTYTFVRGDWRLIRAGDASVREAWVLHGFGLLLVLAWLMAVGAMPLWAYVVAAYGGMSLLKIRTFMEHRAHEKARARTVIIEDRGPLALLYLNNNLHVVHHQHPAVPWYRLPALYAAGKARYTSCNEGYVYRSYADIFRAHLLKAKDPVPHPFYHPH
ncbi:MAG: fatty acid desaturase [Rhodobacteraceae bacterium]|nr:fatty acid desaturase [Paracoccaceae bacterium]